MKIKKILVPVDGSEQSMKAARYAIEMAGQVGAELLLIHCHTPFPMVMGEPQLQVAVKKINEKSMEIMGQFVPVFKESGVTFKDRIIEGHPGDVIPDLARSEKCDMIIMGSRGMSNIKSLVLGSVTHKVLHLAGCPVLVIK